MFDDKSGEAEGEGVESDEEEGGIKSHSKDIGAVATTVLVMGMIFAATAFRCGTEGVTAFVPRSPVMYTGTGEF